MARDAYTEDDYMEDGTAEEEKEEGQEQDQEQEGEGYRDLPEGLGSRFGRFLSERLPELAYNVFWGAIRLIGKTIRTIVFGDDRILRNEADAFIRTMDAERFRAQRREREAAEQDVADELSQEAEQEAEDARESRGNREEGQEAGDEGPGEPGKGDAVRQTASSMGYIAKETDNPDVLRISREGRDGKAREFAVRISDMEGMDEAQMKAHIREASVLAAAQRYLDRKGLILAGADRDAFILQRPEGDALSTGASFSFPRELLDGNLKMAVSRFLAMEAGDPWHKEPVAEGMYRPVTPQEEKETAQEESPQEGKDAPEAEEAGKGAGVQEGPQEPEKGAEAGPSRGMQENAREAAQDAPGTAQEATGKTERDPLLKEAAELVVSREKASTGMIQRAFHIGYTRASGIMDGLEKAGIVGPEQEGKPREVLVSAGDMDRLLSGEPPARGAGETGDMPRGGLRKGVMTQPDLGITEIRFADANDPYVDLIVAGYEVKRGAEAGTLRVTDRKDNAWLFSEGDKRLKNPEAMKATFASLHRLGTPQESLVPETPASVSRTINQEAGKILQGAGAVFFADESRSGDTLYVFAAKEDGTADRSCSWPCSQSSIALGDADGLKRILYEVRNREAIAQGGPLPDDGREAAEAAGFAAAIREKAGLTEPGKTAAQASVELPGEEGRPAGKVTAVSLGEGFLLKEGKSEAVLPSPGDPEAFGYALSSVAGDAPATPEAASCADDIGWFRPEKTESYDHMMASIMLDPPLPPPEEEELPPPIDPDAEAGDGIPVDPDDPFYGMEEQDYGEPEL